MLSDIRVLEISAPSTMLAGRLLADLGADVIVVEPPCGAAGRRLEPFEHGVPGLDRSLTWRAVNHGKRGLTLDWRTPDGRALLADLVSRADVVLEEAAFAEPSPLDGLNLPPTLIRGVIAPFSKNGPKAGYRATDLIIMAASGAPAMAGEPDRPPLFFPVPQAMMEAGADTAVAVLAALAARDRDGLGQTAEVSNRLAAMLAAFARSIAGFATDKPGERTAIAGGAMTGSVSAPTMYPCADGYMLLLILFSPAFAPMALNLIRWAADEGALAAEYADFDWLSYGRPRETPPPEPMAALVAALNSLCATRTKTELTRLSRERKFMAAPVATMKDIAELEHYRGRGLFIPVTQPDGAVIDVPARFAQISDYSIEIKRPAPRLSEHTSDILTAELGLSPTEVQALFVHGVI